MRQIKYIEWCDEELRGTGPFPVTIATMLGMYWEGYIYDHNGD